MKKNVVLACLLLFISALEAKLYQSVPLAKATLFTPTNKPWCTSCGMHLGMFYKTNHALKMKDGKTVQLCSLHCLVEKLAQKKIVADLLVVDNTTLKFIPVERAYYVVGSNIKGTMTKNSKFAFGTQEAAQLFLNEHRGRVVRFSEANELAKKDFINDMKMISTKKRKKVFPMGKKIVTKMCDAKKLSALHAHTLLELKFEIKKNEICGKLNEKQLQMASLYLMMKKNGDGVFTSAISVPENAKCPICGMFVAKYPKWAARIVSSKGIFYFDGAKDFFKYYLKSPEGKLSVTDYYTLKGLDANKAFYVVGSNVFGPMGNELIPFETKTQAVQFFKDHKGKRIFTFSKVDAKLVHSLDQ